jgi:hypothetical protein
MEGHNRTCPSLRWAGLGDEQIFARDTRDWRERRDLKFKDQGSKFRKPRISDPEPLSFSPFPPVSLGLHFSPIHWI